MLIIKPYGKGKYGKRAIVSVKGWHSFTFTLYFLKKYKGIYDMFGSQYTKQAVKYFGKDFNKIFIVPKLPKDKKEVRSIKKYVKEKKGIDHILDFPEILNELIGRVDKKRNYGNSEVLQTIRLLKNYKFLN